MIIEDAAGTQGPSASTPDLDGVMPESGGEARPEEGESTPTAMDLLGVIKVVKPGVASLPELKAPSSETAPVDLQDWLQLTQAPMSDLSDRSEEWWARVQEEAQRCYKEWSKATPLERLNLRGPRLKELEEGKFSRVNARAASMVLQSLDPSVRSDLVSRRLILTLYQPGGEGEKRLVLEQLQNPSRCTEAGKAAEALRQWERWHSRAKAAGVSVPDPTVLARALTTITQPILEKNAEAAFRTSLLRNTLQIDTFPTTDNVLALHRHLLAEAEGLAAGTKKSSSTTAAMEAASRAGGGEQQPKAKGLHQAGEERKPSQPAASSSTAKPCRWFAKTEEGCRRGADCAFQHDWGGVSKAGRLLYAQAPDTRRRIARQGRRA